MVRPANYTRDVIIKAAVVLFAEKGFEGARVRDIATEARVTAITPTIVPRRNEPLHSHVRLREFASHQGLS
jgi:hypothetical protein